MHNVETTRPMTGGCELTDTPWRIPVTGILCVKLTGPTETQVKHDFWGGLRVFCMRLALESVNP